MNINDFIKLRQKDWQQLEALLKRRRGRDTLDAAQARELGTLYRAVMSDLAVARRDYAGQPVVVYLNQLSTRTHSFIYQEDVNDPMQLVRYFTHTIPQTFRRTWVFTLTAFVMFLVPAVAGFRLMQTNPDAAETLGLAEQRAMLAQQETWTDIALEERGLASAFIMSNNIRVTLLAFAGGVTFGLFTVYALTTNGLFIGAVLGLAAHYGMGDTLVEFVVAHGAIELSVIFLAGGAGLQLGWALFSPGKYSRRDALSEAAKRAAAFAVAGIPLLIAAGLIEGFISPSDLPVAVKAAVSVGTGALLYAWLLLAGWEATAAGVTPAYAPSAQDNG